MDIKFAEVPLDSESLDAEKDITLDSESIMNVGKPAVKCIDILTEGIAGSGKSIIIGMVFMQGMGIRSDFH